MAQGLLIIYCCSKSIEKTLLTILIIAFQVTSTEVK